MGETAFLMAGACVRVPDKFLTPVEGNYKRMPGVLCVTCANSSGTKARASENNCWREFDSEFE